MAKDKDLSKEEKDAVRDLPTYQPTTAASNATKDPAPVDPKPRGYDKK
jgi:hypothetical protein